MTDERAVKPKAKRAVTGDAKPPTAKPAAKKPTVKVTATTEKKSAKMPAMKKVAATATGAKAAVKKAPVKKVATVKPVSTDKTKLTPEERYRMVETTAYFIAERHGFQGDSTEHWIAAEREIAAKLGQ